MLEEVVAALDHQPVFRLALVALGEVVQEVLIQPQHLELITPAVEVVVLVSMVRIIKAVEVVQA
jgi:hypothetical protein